MPRFDLACRPTPIASSSLSTTSTDDDAASEPSSTLSASPATSVASFASALGRKMALSRSSSRESSRPRPALPTPPAVSSISMVEHFLQAQAQARALEQTQLSSFFAASTATTSTASAATATASTASATSASTMVRSSQNSPTLSNAPTPTFSSSMVPSPEPLRGRDAGPVPLAAFQLPESVLSRKISAASLQQHSAPAAAAYGSSGIGTVPSFAQEPAPRSTNGNIIRRLSNRASKAITRRRPSSAHPNSRDVSLGPAIIRRRSDSNNTAPAGDAMERPTFDSDSEYGADERDDRDSIAASMFDTAAAHTDGSVTTNGTSSASAPAAAALPPPAAPAQVGPVIPLALLHGIPIRKVSKKNNNKRIILTLDAETGKISWDKARPAKRIYIDDIKDVRTAQDIRQYRLDCNVPESEERRFFSILYTVPDTTQTKLMHLIADTDESFMDWTTTLNAIYKHRQDLMASLMSFNDKAVRDFWNREMAKHAVDKPAAAAATATAAAAGEIDFAGVERVCRNLHIHVPQSLIRSNFHEADVHNTGRLDYAGFQEFVRLMKKRGDIHTIYRTVASSPGLGLTREEFLDFLRNTQGENVDDELASWELVFARFARRPKPGPARSGSGSASASASDGELASGSSSAAVDEGPRMAEAGFAGYLTSAYNLATVKEPKAYTLDRPMSEYYISSSHNTYLLGRQLAGTSSIEGYIAALTRGCRCVEVDCWDGTDGQPIVVHGNTLTSSISFRETINTINRYAFVKSPFPLWISLEVHCNPDQQRIMARIMREVFGSKLVTEPLPSATHRLPSPSELKGRILIKTKKTQQLPPPAAAAPAAAAVSSPSTPDMAAATVSPISATSRPPFPALPALPALPSLQHLPPLPLQSASEVIAASTSEFSGRRRGNSLPSQYQKSFALDGGMASFVYASTASSLASPLSYSSGHGSPVLGPGYASPTTPRTKAGTPKAGTPKARVSTVDTITEGQVSRDVSRELPREVPSSSASDCDSGNEKLPVKAKQSKIVYELGSLAVYCVGVNKTTPFEDADCKLFNHILSWDETVYDRHTRSRDARQGVSCHNMRYLMRVYPRAYRIGSSNFNPLGHWRRGVQMSALNWQTYDLGMQINAAMFTGGTDQSGYVLKPHECRPLQVLPNLPGEACKPRDLKRERKNISFSIGVVSAQQLMRPANFPERRTLDPYVEVEVFLADDKRDRGEGGGGGGGSKQQRSKAAADQQQHLPATPLLYRTRIAAENGFNPVFDQRFSFRFTTKYPDLVFVRLSVKLADGGKYASSSSAPTATFTAKLSNLKQGYRTIPLVDVNADRYMFSTLLCEIHKEPITSVYVPGAADGAESAGSSSAVAGSSGSIGSATATATAATTATTTNNNKLKSIRTVFNRAANQSPKSSMDSGS